MRVYYPATLTMLMSLRDTGEFTPVGGTGFALTPALREAYASGDDDELSEAAIREAARASLRLLSAEESDAQLPVRRAVVAADVDDVTLRPDLEPAVVKTSGPVPVSAIASVHVDLADAEQAVRRGVELIDAADIGDEDAELAVGDVEDYDLAWYATQEVPFLLELL